MKAWKLLCGAAAGVVVIGAVVIGVLGAARDRAWFEPAPAGGAPTARLITAEQYVSALHAIFGDDIEVELNSSLLQRRQGLLTLSAASVNITPGVLDQFERAAYKVARQVVDENHRTLLSPCVPSSLNEADAACAEEFFTRIGRYLFRRPLTKAEAKAYAAIAGAAADQLDDFYGGLSYALAGMLASPKFIYLTELREPNPDHPGRTRLDSYSKALRLSLFLWNALPDESLIAAAEKGEIHKRDGLEREVDRMLASPRLEVSVRAFFSDLLAFEKFNSLSKDAVIYPAFTRAVAISAKEQTLRLIVDHLLTRKGDYRDLFTTTRTFVDFSLGPLYEAQVPSPQSWIPVDLDSSHSAGLLTSLSFLALHSHPGRSSPTLRGKAFRELLLCQRVPDPPPNVNFEIFEDPNSRFKTARDRLDAHSSDPVCAGCHKLTDPIGLSLENFDGAGEFRSTENNAPIDPSGNLDGQAFTNIASLGKAMHDHSSLAPCLTSRLFAYGVGREVTPSDRPTLGFLVKRFALDGYRVPDLMREIALSDAFFAVAQPDRPDDDAGPSTVVADVAGP